MQRPARPSGLPLRLLVWGVFSPETLTLRAAGRRLRPVAAITGPDDDELRQAMRTMETRLRQTANCGLADL